MPKQRAAYTHYAYGACCCRGTYLTTFTAAEMEAEALCSSCNQEKLREVAQPWPSQCWLYFDRETKDFNLSATLPLPGNAKGRLYIDGLMAMAGT